MYKLFIRISANVKRFMIFKVILLIFVVSLYGCATPSLWSTSGYGEEIDGFFLSEENQLLILSGEKFSYVFTANDTLIDVIKLREKQPYYIRNENFKIDKANNATVAITFHCLDALCENLEDHQLKMLGFKKNQHLSLGTRFELTGKRYEVEGQYPFEKLKKPYYLYIEQTDSTWDTMGKIVVTPLTITLDAIIAITVVSIAVVVLLEAGEFH